MKGSFVLFRCAFYTHSATDPLHVQQIWQSTFRFTRKHNLPRFLCVMRQNSDIRSDITLSSWCSAVTGFYSRCPWLLENTDAKPACGLISEDAAENALLRDTSLPEPLQSCLSFLEKNKQKNKQAKRLMVCERSIKHSQPFHCLIQMHRHSETQYSTSEWDAILQHSHRSKSRNCTVLTKTTQHLQYCHSLNWRMIWKITHSMSSYRKCLHKTNKMLFQQHKPHQCSPIYAPSELWSNKVRNVQGTKTSTARAHTQKRQTNK